MARILAGTDPHSRPPRPRSTPGLQIPQPLVGHTRYQIIAELGAGGMGTVFKVRHLLMDRLAALKVINAVKRLWA